jgi:ketosteroid isomerase-like protein
VVLLRRGVVEIVGSTDAAVRVASVPSLSTADHHEENDMTAIATIPIDDGTAQELSERLADVFRTGDVGDVLTEDVFLDGHPPLWRFQLQGRDTFAAWLGGYSPEGAETTVVRTVPTSTGFVTEFVGRHDQDGEEMTDRKILLCEVRSGQVAELIVYCSGDWDAELRARHAAEAPIIRP